jgi:glycosyltransferase involved in cell wall biosynthesis
MRPNPIKKKIAIFQSDLKVGGIQKSLINLLNHIDYDKYEIDLYLISLENFYKKNLPEEVNVKPLKNLSRIERVLPFQIIKNVLKNRYAYLNVESYHVAVDFNGYQPATALATLSTNSKSTIMWVHGNIRMRLRTDATFRMNWMLQKAKILYFNHLVVVSAGLVRDVQSFTKSKIFIVNNIIDTDTIIQESLQDAPKITQDKYNLVSVGRLTADKNVAETLGVFKDVLQKRGDIHLYIIGDGPERKKLIAMSQRLRINSHVTFLGALSNPYAFMKIMDGYISTSKHEGQGMSILEAKSLGLEIFIPKYLEAYSHDVVGKSDLSSAVSKALKTQNKLTDPLVTYNHDAIEAFYKVVNSKSPT